MQLIIALALGIMLVWLSVPINSTTALVIVGSCVNDAIYNSTSTWYNAHSVVCSDRFGNSARDCRFVCKVFRLFVVRIVTKFGV